ncbi:hypothetical protein FA15DRAFT_724261 [Coprinopsis marcescibilis]|uniref:Uncharacterized protein n=1 Tax=Coprinopsis marcescibilis TaxID=230819 RepID=A0A5C3KH25_COPMA|nr:hypothetical protein FA15DRAFT_724261 [Coprinopsis marcescibilis]
MADFESKSVRGIWHDDGYFETPQHSLGPWFAKGACYYPDQTDISDSRSYDGKVPIWKEPQGQESSPGGWGSTHCTQHLFRGHPHELGAILACACPDAAECKADMKEGCTVQLVPHCGEEQRQPSLLEAANGSHGRGTRKPRYFRLVQLHYALGNTSPPDPDALPSTSVATALGRNDMTWLDNVDDCDVTDQRLMRIHVLTDEAGVNFQDNCLPVDQGRLVVYHSSHATFESTNWPTTQWKNQGSDSGIPASNHSPIGPSVVVLFTPGIRPKKATSQQRRWLSIFPMS